MGLFALILGTCLYWFSTPILLNDLNAYPAPPRSRLSRIVCRLSHRLRLPMPRVYLIPQRTPNAMAAGRNSRHGVVAATSGLLLILDDEELEAVMAHELAHVRNGDVLAATVVHVLMAGFGHIPRASAHLPAQGVALLAYFVGAVFQCAYSRTRELQADTDAALMSGNPLALARALQKIEAASKLLPLGSAADRFFLPDSQAGVFDSHPASPERIAFLIGLHRRLHATPARLLSSSEVRLAVRPLVRHGRRAARRRASPFLAFSRARARFLGNRLSTPVDRYGLASPRLCPDFSAPMARDRVPPCAAIGRPRFGSQAAGRPLTASSWLRWGIQRVIERLLSGFLTTRMHRRPSQLTAKGVGSSNEVRGASEGPVRSNL